MFHAILFAARPSFLDHLHVASPPTEPEAIAVYALIGCAAWLVWMGNRNSGKSPENPDGSPPETASIHSESHSGPGERSGDVEPADDEERGKRDSRGSGKKRKLTRAERRKRGHINWIQ